MITRTLSKRVQRLEAPLIPTDEPMVIHVKYVSPDGTVTDGYTIGGHPKTLTENGKGCRDDGAEERAGEEDD
jgi:hypothetical protein